MLDIFHKSHSNSRSTITEVNQKIDIDTIKRFLLKLDEKVSYFKSTPYKITPYFSKKNVQTVDLYRETNIHPSILFSPPHFKGTFAVFSQGYFIMTL